MGFDSPEKHRDPKESYACSRRHSGTHFVSHGRKPVCSGASYLLKYMETLQHAYLQFWLLSSGFCSLHTSCISWGRNHLSCPTLAHQHEWTVLREQWSSPGMHFHLVTKWTYPENKWELNKQRKHTKDFLVWSIPLQVNRFPVTSLNHVRPLQAHPHVHNQGMIFPKRILVGCLKCLMPLEALDIKKVPISYEHSSKNHLAPYTWCPTGNTVFDYMGTKHL